MTGLRDIGLAGPSNFRDLGGYPTIDGAETRWGRVFRSDTLRFTDDDVVVLRDTVGLRFAIDLRAGFEYGHLDGGGKPAYVERLTAVGVTRVALPMIDETRVARQANDPRPIAARSYLKMFERGADALATSLRIIADEQHQPLVFHCSAGKDRTGVLAAVLLGLLGVDDETIVADYALSQANMQRALAKIRARPDAERILANRPVNSFEAPSEAAIGFVEAVHATYGGWEPAVVEVLGLDEATIASLRRLLRTSG